MTIYEKNPEEVLLSAYAVEHTKNNTINNNRNFACVFLPNFFFEIISIKESLCFIARFVKKQKVITNCIANTITIRFEVAGKNINKRKESIVIMLVDNKYLYGSGPELKNMFPIYSFVPHI